MFKMKYSGVEWIGSIPENWNIDKLKYCTNEISSGGTPESSNLDYYDDINGIPWVAIGDMSTKEYISNTSKKLTLEGIKSKNLKIYPSGTLLYSIFATIGKTSFLQTAATINQAILAIIPNKKIDKLYLKYQLNAMEEYVLSECSTNTQNNLNSTKVKNFNLVLPELMEQKLIANFLDEKVSNLDNILIDLRKQIEILNDYRKSLITECITKGLDKNIKFKESRVGKIPLSWETKPIKYICNIQPKVCYKNIREDDFVTFLPMDHIKKGYFINNQAKLYDNDNSYTSFEEGDIIMAKVTPCFENGNIAITKDLHNGYGFGSSELFVFRANDYVEQKFLFYWLQNDNFVKTATSNMTGAAGLKRVPLNFIRNYYISIPKLDEQKEIVDYLDKKCEQIDKIIEEKQKQIEKIEEYKKSVIYEYVTGKKRVEGAEELYG